MSLYGSLTSGVSAMLSQSESISIISDNLANVNTIGYKNTRTLFRQQVTSSGVSGTLVNAGGVSTDFQRFQATQGSLLSTQSSTDIALSGNGFFTVISDTEVDNETSFFYSRAGAFSEDNRGFLTSPTGQYLLGWRTDTDGTIQDVQNPTAVELQSVASSARATGELILGVNLNAEADTYAYDTTMTHQANIEAVVADPSLATFVTDVRFFDSQGAARDVNIAFNKRSANEWDWVAYADGGDVVSDFYGNASAAGSNSAIGVGTLEFDADGALKIVGGETFTVDWDDGVGTEDITVNFGDYTGGGYFDTIGAGLQFADGVLGISVDENHPSAPATLAGTYSFSNDGLNAGTGLYEITVTEPDGSTFTVGTSNTADERLLEFANGVNLTLSANFDFTATPVGAMGSADITAPLTGPLDIGRGTNGVIQFASPFNTLFANQDGFGSGTLASVTVDEEGFIIGSFTNGEAKKLWKVVVAVFQDPSSLEPVSNNLLRETDASGRPLYKEAGVGGTATIVSGALEQSTVDIAQEFSNMITSQRSFQAASTVISTVDQMLNELLQIR